MNQTDKLVFYRHPKVKKELPITYVNKDDDRIQIYSCFIYELSVSKYIVDGKQRRYEFYGTKFLKTNKEIRSQTIIKYFPNKKKMEYCIIKSLNMLGAPKEFIYENHFPKWELKKKKQNEKGKSSLRKRRVR